MTFSPGLEDSLHRFGSDTITYPNEFDITDMAFAGVFELYLTRHVSDRWTQSNWEQVLDAMMSSNTADMSDDVFGVVWNYFLREGIDADSTAAGIGMERTIAGRACRAGSTSTG